MSFDLKWPAIDGQESQAAAQALAEPVTKVDGATLLGSPDKPPGSWQVREALYVSLPAGLRPRYLTLRVEGYELLRPMMAQ